MSDMTPRFEPCDQTTQLGAYLLGGMNESESRIMRTHIDSCVHCSKEVRALRPIVDLLDSTELASSILGERLEPAPEIGHAIFARAAAELQPRETYVAPHAIAIEPLRTRRRATLVAASVVAFSLGAGSMLGGQKLIAARKPKPQGERISFARVSLDHSVPAPPPGPHDPKAWVWLSETPAGTYAWLYVKNFKQGEMYRWWFKKADGSRLPLGSFRYPGLKPGDPWLICPGSSSALRSEIIAVGASDSSGVDVLDQTLPPPPKFVKT